MKKKKKKENLKKQKQKTKTAQVADFAVASAYHRNHRVWLESRPT